MRKKSIFSVFFILIVYICTVPVAVSLASEDVGNSQAVANADLGIEVIDGLVSMDVRNAEIRCVLQEIAKKAKLRLDISDDIDGRVTISAKALSLKDILKRLCENRAVVYQYIPEKKTCRIISVGAYSKGKSEVEFAQEERLYDSRGRLLYKPGELLVRFKKDATEKQIADLHKSMGNTVEGGIARIRLQRVKLREGLSERDAIKAYMSSGIVEVAERHALRYANATVPNDEYFGEQWGLHNTGQILNYTAGIADADIDAPEAWDITTGSSDIIIAVIDTGVDYFHPDLANNIWVNVDEVPGDGVDNDGNGYIDDVYGWDFAGNDEAELDDADSDPMDVDGHGTHVAGIIAAEGNNALGVAGVCWNAKIMVLKVQADNSEYMEGITIIQAMHYAIDNGARIVNCSFGGEGEEMSEFDAATEFQGAGIIAVCAAGNGDEAGNPINMDGEGEIKEYPACYDLENIISVAASTQDDKLANFSNYGKTSVDVMAPGVAIKSTIPASSYGIMRGTSMAAPHVSGIAGLILSKTPGLDYSAVKSAILSSVDKLQSVSDKMVSGGRLNALNALCSVNTLPGDLSFNGMVGLDDAIIVFQIISGLHPNICSVCISPQIDVNGDGRIGLEESIYVMQKIAGLL